MPTRASHMHPAFPTCIPNLISTADPRQCDPPAGQYNMSQCQLLNFDMACPLRQPHFYCVDLNGSLLDLQVTITVV